MPPWSGRPPRPSLRCRRRPRPLRPLPRPPPRAPTSTRPRSAPPSRCPGRVSGRRAPCRCPPTPCAARSTTSPAGTPPTARACSPPPCRSRAHGSRSSRRSTRPTPRRRICTSTRSSPAAEPEMPSRRSFGDLAAMIAREGWSERPMAVLDLDAFDANAEDLARRAAGTPLRVASKSLRVRGLLERVLARPGYAGILAFTLPEALWLVRHGVRDVVVAYPTAERAAVRRLAASPEALEAITLMVDETAQLDLLLDATADLTPRTGGRRIRVALELDVSFTPLPGVRFGALRSPVHTPAQAVALAREVLARPRLELVGMMAYEGHIAGVTDAARTPYGAAVRTMKHLSRPDIAARRAEAVSAVREIAELEFVNGGGTGSIESTAAEEAVTEIAAGSGLIGPGLFDRYRDFSPHPALLLGVSVVRRPSPGVATLLGGGWIASGVPGPDRLPTIAHPPRLAFAPQEAAGEVQTPVVGPAAEALRVGDTVWLRHAKAGEPAEHFSRYVLVQGDEIVGTAPTYRGEGAVFL